MVLASLLILSFSGILFFGHIVKVKEAEAKRSIQQHRLLVELSEQNMPDVIWTDAIYAGCAR